MVEGRGLRGTVQEQDLKDAGVLHPHATVAKGKGYEAQYTLTPRLTFSEQDAGPGLAGVTPWFQCCGIADWRAWLSK